MVHLERARAEDDFRRAVFAQRLGARRVECDAEIVAEETFGEGASSSLFHSQEGTQDDVVGVLGHRHGEERRRQGAGNEDGFTTSDFARATTGTRDAGTPMREKGSVSEKRAT